MVSNARRAEIRALLAQARKNGGRPFVANIIEGDRRTVVILADKSDFVYRKLKQAAPDILAILQERRPDATQVIVTTKIKDKDARAAIELGGTVMIFRGIHQEGGR